MKTISKTFTFLLALILLTMGLHASAANKGLADENRAVDIFAPAAVRFPQLNQTAHAARVKPAQRPAHCLIGGEHRQQALA